MKIGIEESTDVVPVKPPKIGIVAHLRILYSLNKTHPHISPFMRFSARGEQRRLLGSKACGPFCLRFRGWRARGGGSVGQTSVFMGMC